MLLQLSATAWFEGDFSIVKSRIGDEMHGVHIMKINDKCIGRLIDEDK